MWSLKGSFVASMCRRSASAELLGDLVFRALQSAFGLPNKLPIDGVTRACFWWQDVDSVLGVHYAWKMSWNQLHTCVSQNCAETWHS